MKLFYWDRQVNFGDQLNRFLWPKIFPDTFDDNDADLFLGIGSIIWPGFPPNSIKHVFGSGYGGGKLPKIDEKWMFHFVRGPKTCKSLGLSPSLAITDPAVLVKRFIDTRKTKKHEVSFIPHWSAAKYRIYYRDICHRHQVNYISPLDSPDHIIDEILTSKLLITEALHGAIVADALRIPWIPVDMHGVNQFKWEDWCESLNFPYTPIRLGPNNILKKVVKKIKVFDTLYIGLCLQRFSRSSKVFLSEGTILNTLLERMDDKVEQFRYMIS